VVAFEEKMTAERLDAFPHAAETVSFPAYGMLAVVFDDKAALVVLSHEAQAAGGRAGVTNDVGDGFAESEREGYLLRHREVSGASGGGVESEGHARGIEGEARGFDLSAKATSTVATNSLADLGECAAGDAFNVNNLGSGTVVTVGILAPNEAAG
jgi:hypothetical protein